MEAWSGDVPPGGGLAVTTAGPSRDRERRGHATQGTGGRRTPCGGTRSVPRDGILPTRRMRVTAHSSSAATLGFLTARSGSRPLLVPKPRRARPSCQVSRTDCCLTANVVKRQLSLLSLPCRTPGPVHPRSVSPYSEVHRAAPVQWRPTDTHRHAAGSGALILVVTGQLDLDNVAPLDETLQQAARDGDGPVVVDLSAVTFADSATVNVLLQAHDALGTALRLAAPSAALERLFALTGLDTVLPLYETVGKAVEA